jgi:hypothetical protein
MYLGCLFSDDLILSVKFHAVSLSYLLKLSFHVTMARFFFLKVPLLQSIDFSLILCNKVLLSLLQIHRNLLMP